MGSRGDSTDPCVRSCRVPCWLSCCPSSGRAMGCALLQLSCSLFCIGLVTFYEWKYYKWVKLRTLSDILQGTILTQFLTIIWYMLQGLLDILYLICSLRTKHISRTCDSGIPVSFLSALIFPNYKPYMCTSPNNSFNICTVFTWVDFLIFWPGSFHEWHESSYILVQGCS